MARPRKIAKEQSKTVTVAVSRSTHDQLLKRQLEDSRKAGTRLTFNDIISELLNKK